MMDAQDLYERVRVQLIGDLHIGRLQPGARVTSIRSLARNEDVDHRLAAQVYARLENEGLIEIRGRSGVFLRERRTHARPPSHNEPWLEAIASEFARRRTPLPRLARLVADAVQPHLKCVCVESTEDHEVAMCAELQQSFGITARVSRIRPSPAGRSNDAASYSEAVDDADFVVTTAFHAAEVGAVAESAGRPLVTLMVNPAFAHALAELLQRTLVTVVAADAAFIDRARQYMVRSRHADRFRVLRYDHPMVPALDPDDPGVVYTRAARRRLRLHEYHYRENMPPFFDAESLATLARLIVRMNLQAEHGH